MEAIKANSAALWILRVSNAAVMVNNADWTMKLSVVEFLRDVGKNFSLNTMLDRDTVKRRLESDGISYTRVLLHAPAVQ